MYVGRRINPPNPTERTGPGAIEVQHNCLQSVLSDLFLVFS